MKKLTYILVAVFLIIIAIIAVREYKQKKREDAALAYYALAQEYYDNNQIDSAIIILDSLALKYPTTLNDKRPSEILRLSIEKKIASDSINSISEAIYQYEIELLNTNRSNEPGTDSLNIHRDSLIKIRDIIKGEYNQIQQKESQYTCPQCVTHIRNARKR